VGGRRLREVVLLQGGYLEEEGLEGNGQKGRRMGIGYNTYITLHVYA
jgi:hypothetical protein